MDFYATVGGQRFIDGTVPKLSKNIEKLADGVNRLCEILDSKAQSEKAVTFANDSERLEFFGQIIDTFEDFMDEHGIDYVGEDFKENGEDPEENTAHLYGSDYDEIQSQLEGIMTAWGILPKDVSECQDNSSGKGRNISPEKIRATEAVLIDNGIEPDEADTVLQAIGYVLLDEELYPEGK